MKEILNNSVFENILNKSKFIACSFAVHTNQEIEKALKSLREKYFDATHICYAFSLLGGTEKAVDDGEPQGTAGKPILDCIKKSGYSNTLIAVVRYFGGVKLGAGGLVRAYSGSASKVLNISGEKVTEECKKLSFTVLISESRMVSKLEQIAGVKKVDTKYTENINIDFYCKQQDISNIISTVENILCKKIDFNIDDKIYFV